MSRTQIVSFQQCAIELIAHADEQTVRDSAASISSHFAKRGVSTVIDVEYDVRAMTWGGCVRWVNALLTYEAPTEVTQIDL